MVTIRLRKGFVLTLLEKREEGEEKEKEGEEKEKEEVLVRQKIESVDPRHSRSLNTPSRWRRGTPT